MPDWATRAQEELIEAWQRLLSFDPPPDPLMRVLVAEVERHSGIKVDLHAAAACFRHRIAPPPPKQLRTILTNVVVVNVKAHGEYINRHPAWFRFEGRRHRVQEWRELVGDLCSAVAENDPKDFAVVIDRIQGQRRVYFSREQSALKEGRLVKGTDIYVETNLAANNAKALCDALVRLFGYGGAIEVGLQD